MTGNKKIYKINRNLHFKKFMCLFSPINFLNPRHRLVYVLACGALASQWFRLLEITMSLNTNKWATPIVHRKNIILVDIKYL